MKKMTMLILSLFINFAYADTDLEKLYNTLEGSFSSANQSIYHSSFFNVTVRHCPINIVDGNPNSRYLILRQAVAKYYPSPYRVRLVELTKENNQIKSKNYAPARKLDVSQFCDNSSVPTLYLSDFAANAKCVLTITDLGNKYLGTTGIPGCPSTRNGASFVSSEVEITNEYFTSLDRGWDSKGNQVWGSTSGPYIFEKTKFENINPNVGELATMLAGESSNKDQNLRDPDFFALVKNKTCPVKLKNGSEEGVINLITNQTVQARGSAVGRTSLYQIKSQNKGQGLSEVKIVVYPVNEANLADYCSREDAWNTPQDIQLNSQPCTVNFQKKSVSSVPYYEGKTQVGGCASSFRGANKLIIDERIDFFSIKVWEKWLDANDNQVAGSTKGFYEYRKLSDYKIEYKVK